MRTSNDTFGRLLRSLRLESGVGLRELSRLIEKSPGYLSDVESGNVPPPSKETIVQIANALNVDKKTLLNAAKKIDPELSEYVAEQPQVADFLRMAKDQEFNDDDWDRLTQLAKLSKLGKGEGGKV
ncbi:MAG: helix-turn-helix transcriptional regulator [Desulfobacterales bacterium]|jgi:transcriptional regulator with XRE-family HTH domain